MVCIGIVVRPTIPAEMACDPGTVDSKVPAAHMARTDTTEGCHVPEPVPDNSPARDRKAAAALTYPASSSTRARPSSWRAAMLSDAAPAGTD